MDRFPQEFGERVRRCREKHGLSQDELAVSAGMHRNYVGAIERGEYNISLKNARKIADALGISLVQLVEEGSASSNPTEAEQLRAAIMKILKRQRGSKLRMILNVVREISKGRN